MHCRRRCAYSRKGFIMTKKHYAIIARELFLYGASRELIAHMAEALLKDNPRFDRASFYKACGI